jgi:hypothetical protein
VRQDLERLNMRIMKRPRNGKAEPPANSGTANPGCTISEGTAFRSKTGVRIQIGKADQHAQVEETRVFTGENNGRPEWTRTIDLFRVKLSVFSIFNNLQG